MPDGAMNAAFAFLALERDSLLRIAWFSSTQDIVFESLDSQSTDELALSRIQGKFSGVISIARQAARLQQQLIPAGFVAFDPIDLDEFEALFGSRSRGGNRFEDLAHQIAEHIDWLVARGGPFVRQLENWAFAGRPDLVSFFSRVADIAETHPERILSAAERRQARQTARSSRPAGKKTDVPEIPAIFGPDGGLARFIPGYERRDGQVQMASAVSDALHHDGVLLCEAGTGIGKSLAYLIPSAIWAREQGTPVLVSTFTRGLQEQLVSKDIPLASEAIQACGGDAVQGVALKGRSNYLCLRRWMQESREAHSEPAMDALKIKISIWLETTTSGDRAELALSPAEDRVFSSLSAQTDNCLQTVCRATLGNRCFFNRSRAEAQKADIVVMNHALLFASLGEENSVVGNLDKLIVDEAHHLEAVATSRYSFVCSGPRLARLLSEYAVLQGSSILGHCGKAVEALSATGALQTKPANARKALEILRGAVTAVERGLHWSEQLFTAAIRLVEDQDDTSGYGITRRILASTRDQPNWQTLYEIWESLDAVFADLLQSSRWLIGELGDASGQSEALERIEPALLDLSVWRRDLEEIQGQLRAVIAEPNPAFVYWMAGRKNAGEASMHGAPLGVAELVSGELLSHTSSAVFASATLRSQGSFHLLKQQLGIEDADELVLPSPFDYRSSTLLYIARDVPDPRHAAYLDSVREAVAGLADALDGRTLALFTSHAAIRGVAPRLREQLEPLGITVMAQDIDGTANQLVERMKRNPNTVVLGVAAFWEGVDVPGDELSGLVVTRLPFDVPTDPLFAARSEQFEQPFQQYSLPRAALKFRQGFGRLIRSSSDRGVVAVLDSRIFTKNYGSTFMRALPECTVRHGPVHELGPSARAWLRQDRQTE